MGYLKIYPFLFSNKDSLVGGTPRNFLELQAGNLLSSSTVQGLRPNRGFSDCSHPCELVS